MMRQSRLDDSPIAYYISGNGHDEWCMFLHAAFVDHRMFNKQIAYFENRYNVLAVDIIGHGQSTDTKKGDSIDQMSAWLRDILKAEKIKKIHLVGVSLGSVLAQDFANRYPETVNSLACFGGYDINHFDVKAQRKNSASQILMMLKAMISVKWFAAANKKISACTPQAQTEFYDMNIQFPKKSFMYLSSLNHMVNVCQAGPRTYPLMIGCGQYDIPQELAEVKLWKSREPQCKVVIFENAGHCVNMDAPQKFNEAIEQFWEKCSAVHRTDVLS